jgi:luciferase family oxidoreductase group 1
MSKPSTLSVLDVTPVTAGASASQALADTVALAQHVERLGYHRFWLAEHHNTAAIASPAPEVVMTHVADKTSRIRIGAGGIMLPNHSPLKVAETFRVLEALFPGRIDLGLGRAPGTDPLAALALRRSRDTTPDDFPALLTELLAFFDDDFPADHQFASVRATPPAVDTPPIYLLGSTDFSYPVAASLGLGFAFAHHINPEPAVPALRAYRDEFVPSTRNDTPQPILAVSVVCADTDDDAEALMAPLDLHWLRVLAQNSREPMMSTEDARAYRYTPEEEKIRRSFRSRHVVGSTAHVAERLRTMAEDADVDEVMVFTMLPELEARKHSYELLAEEFGLSPSWPRAPRRPPRAA